MISDSQLEANRANAQKSTGPTTEAGKTAIRLNATRHGLTSHVACMTWEDRDAFNQFCAAIVADLKPEGALETQLAQAIAEDQWRINRAHAIEETLFALGSFESNIQVQSGDQQIFAALAQAETFRNDAKSFNLITLYEARIHRNMHRNMERFEQIQDARRARRANALAELTALNDMNRAHRAEAVRSHNGFDFSDVEIALAARGRKIPSRLAEATAIAAGPPQTANHTREITYRDAA